MNPTGSSQYDRARLSFEDEFVVIDVDQFRKENQRIQKILDCYTAVQSDQIHEFIFSPLLSGKARKLDVRKQTSKDALSFTIVGEDETARCTQVCGALLQAIGHFSSAHGEVVELLVDAASVLDARAWPYLKVKPL